MTTIAAVVLAAGGSTRFGQPKQLLDWNGVPLLAHVVDEALDAGLAPVVVVLGAHADAIRPALGTRPVQVLTNYRWAEGLSTSLHVGLSALPPEVAGAVFLQGDQPLVSAALLRSLVARFEESGAPIVHPAYEGRRGTPVLFARRLFPELAAVHGDEGGRGLIERHGSVAVPVDDPDILADVDTPEDYRRLRARAGSAPVDLSRIRHLIVDMDGVLWRGDAPLPGLREFFDTLRRRGLDFILATNNSSRLPEQYAAKLRRFGVEVPPSRVLTSSEATAAYLQTVAPHGTPVYAVGGEGLHRALERAGFVQSDTEARYVIVGWEMGLDWEQMVTASLLIHAGAEFIGTNPDPSYPTPRGPVPGNGARLALLEATTGVSPVVVGKPEPWMYREALRRMGASPERTAAIGDRLTTDIAGGRRLGMRTILVLSGATTPEALAASSIRPDWVFADIGEVAHALAEAG